MSGGVAFLHVGLPVHDEYLLVFEQQVAVVVAEVIGVALASAVKVCEVAEVEPCQLEHPPSEGGLALGTVALKYKTVMAQLRVDLLHQALALILSLAAIFGN